MHILKASLFVTLFACSLAGCTANVENPQLSQTGRAGNTTCVSSCDDANTTCVAKCSDDACKATCTTDLDNCKTMCSAADGG